MINGLENFLTIDELEKLDKPGYARFDDSILDSSGGLFIKFILEELIALFHT